MKALWHPRRNAGVISLAGLAAAFVMATSVLTAGQGQPQGQVTFTKDIAPILQRSCQNCHRPNGGIAPMALTTYEEARPWAKAIKQRTSLREMPPWFIEKNIGIQQFKEDLSISDKEIATIAAWADGGAVRGNPADMPPPRQFADRNAWTIGEPDLVVTSPLKTVKAVGGDWHGPIGATPTGMTEDRWIAAVQVREFRPEEAKWSAGRAGGGNNYFVVHHAGIGTTPALGEEGGGDAAAAAAAADARARSRGERSTNAPFNYLYEVGQNAQYYPDDMGVPLKAGSTIYFNGAHLHSIGKEVKMHLQIGFKFHPKGYTPKHTIGLVQLRTPLSGWGAELDIPGNTDDVRYDKFFTLRQPGRMVTFEPHLHASGKRMCFEAIYPDGKVETLNCAGYNHAWAKSYVYDDDSAPLLPTGTIIHVTAWYNNTASNPRVVDPRNWKGLGHRSIDDMFIFMNKVVFYTEDEFKAEVTARDAKRRQATSTAARNNGN